MTLEQIKKYTEGTLKKWFTNKKTILDKLGKDDNGYLKFDNTTSWNGIQLYAVRGYRTTSVVQGRSPNTN